MAAIGVVEFPCIQQRCLEASERFICDRSDGCTITTAVQQQRSCIVANGKAIFGQLTNHSNCNTTLTDPRSQRNQAGRARRSRNLPPNARWGTRPVIVFRTRGTIALAHPGSGLTAGTVASLHPIQMARSLTEPTFVQRDCKRQSSSSWYFGFGIVPIQGVGG